MTNLDNARDNYILTNLYSHYEDANEKYGDNVFCVCLQGSQNYGLDMYTDEYKSDIDSKCIVLPTFEDFCNTNAPLSTTFERHNKEHIDFKDIRVMFDVFRKQNVNFVEILFTDYFVVNDKWLDFYLELRKLGESLVHAHPAQTLRTMAGMSMEKRKAMCHPYPTIIDKINKYGYDGKQLHHIIRINDFMKRYIDGESFKSCLTPLPENVSLLMDAKLNKFKLDEALMLANTYDACNNKLKDNYIEKYGNSVNVVPYNQLNDLKVAILKKHFTEELKQ